MMRTISNFQKIWVMVPFKIICLSWRTDIILWIVAGTIPIKSSDENRVMASTITYNNDGERVSVYNKIHLFDVTLTKIKESYNESKYFMPGEKIEVIDTPIGRAGIACCYDLDFLNYLDYNKIRKLRL